MKPGDWIKRRTAEQRREQSSQGGRTVLTLYGPDYFRQIGRIGGLKVSKDRDYMSKLGRLGGKAARRRPK